MNPRDRKAINAVVASAPSAPFTAYVEQINYLPSGKTKTFSKVTVTGRNMGQFWATSEPSQYFILGGHAAYSVPGTPRRLLIPGDAGYDAAADLMA